MWREKHVKENVRKLYMFLFGAHSKGGEVNNINKQELCLCAQRQARGWKILLWLVVKQLVHNIIKYI